MTGAANVGDVSPDESPRYRGHSRGPWAPCPHTEPLLQGTPRVALPSWQRIEHLDDCTQAVAILESIAGYHLTVLERSGGELARLRYAAAEARLRALRLSHALCRLLDVEERDL